MKVVKVTSSGQITLPKLFRDKYKTEIFTYSIIGDRCVIVPVKITTLIIEKPLLHKTKKRYTLKDLRRAQFHSKNKKITNLSEQVDEIIADINNNT